MTIDAQGKITLLEAENARLKADNARLRKLAGGRRAAFVERINRAHADALLLCTARSEGYGVRPSRQFAKEHFEMGRRRWQAAIALLRMARIFGHRDWVALPSADVTARLDNARDGAIETPGAFYARLSKHGRSDWERRQRLLNRL